MTVRILVGDCRVLMLDEPASSIDSIVTDPPYDLLSVSRNGSRRKDPPNNPYGRHGERSGGGFMGMAWDATGVAFEPETWAAALRILKPGGHLVAFGGTRTFHRLTCAIEDAGFEIRDVLSWLYGSGFPKSLDVSKAIDKAAGAQRAVVGDKLDRPGYHLHGHDGGEAFGAGLSSSTPETRLRAALITAPATEPARDWAGWGTALKPAWEPIVLARKPLTEPNVAANVLRHGTGAVNVDGCRIERAKPELVTIESDRRNHPILHTRSATATGNVSLEGRWPANVALDEEAAAMLDEQSGELTSGTNPTRRGTDKFRGIYSAFRGQEDCEAARGVDVGGASRFFYTSKASGSERKPDERHMPGEGNAHPTVKPIDLMRWLVRMVTPPGGTVCDPFMGSGSTGIAASREGFGFLGMEQQAEYAEIARRRIASDAPLFSTLAAD